MAIVVTGGAGFIGSMVCRKLVQAGREVVAIDSLANGRRELLDSLGEGIRVEVADIRDSQAMRKIVSDASPEAVCHLAALHFIPYCNAHPEETVDVNIRGTLNVLEACKAEQVGMVVIASTTAVYPICESSNRETDAPGPLDIYGVTKRCNEDLGRLYVAETGAPCIAARIFNAVGSNETNPHLVPHLAGQTESRTDECVIRQS